VLDIERKDAAHCYSAPYLICTVVNLVHYQSSRLTISGGVAMPLPENIRNDLPMIPGQEKTYSYNLIKTGGIVEITRSMRNLFTIVLYFPGDLVGGQVRILSREGIQQNDLDFVFDAFCDRALR
jgi:hypothetical protein